jgi:hypothetical protein
MNSKGSVFGRARPTGAPKLLLLITIVIAALVMGTRDGFAQTFPNQTPPQSNTTSSRPQPTNTGAPGRTTVGKTQTTRTERPITQSKSHQAGKQYGHGQGRGGGVGFGVGATIDLSGIGQRRPEPNPFGVPTERQPVTARTEEKPKTPKKPRDIATTDPFAGLQLIGPKAKEEAAPNRADMDQTTGTNPFRDVRLTGEQAKEEK